MRVGAINILDRHIHSIFQFALFFYCPESMMEGMAVSLFQEQKKSCQVRRHMNDYNVTLYCHLLIIPYGYLNQLRV